MSQNVPNGDLASAIRAARAWSGKSRAQLGRDLGVAAGTIGRWERGDWKDPPRGPMLAALARACDIDDLLDRLPGLLSGDPATRFAAAARGEAQQLRERPDSTAAGHHDEDVAGQGL